MARNRDPFNQALSGLQAGIKSGRLRAGGQVIVADEAARMRLSITPVREALARLNGEGLVERAPSGGYLVVRLESAEVSDGYRLLERLILLARGMTGPSPDDHIDMPALPDTASPGASVNYLFDRIIRGSGNTMLAACHSLVRRRLAPLARAEGRVFPDIQAEADRLYGVTSRSAFETVVQQYFERRASAAALLVRVAEEMEPSPEDLTA